MEQPADLESLQPPELGTGQPAAALRRDSIGIDRDLCDCDSVCFIAGGGVFSG